MSIRRVSSAALAIAIAFPEAVAAQGGGEGGGGLFDINAGLSAWTLIVFVGLLIILYVALAMIWEGSLEIHDAVTLAPLPLPAIGMLAEHAATAL